MVDTNVPWVAKFWSAIAGAHQGEHRPGQFTLPAGAPFTKPESHIVPWTRPMRPDDLVALHGTYSPVLAMDAGERAHYLKRQREVLELHAPVRPDGLIGVPYRTVCWRTRQRCGRTPKQA